MQDPPPEDPEDDANMTFADLLEETANGVSSKIEAAADAAAKEEAPAAAKEEARWPEPQPEEWRKAAAGTRWRSRNAAPDGRVRVAIQAVGSWASVQELFRAIEKQQTRPIAWIFMSRRGPEGRPSYRTRFIDVDKSPMIRQGELAYAQHTFVPHGDAKYRCDPVWDHGHRGESRSEEDTQKAASAGHGPASSAQVPPEPKLFNWGSKQQSNAWVRRPNVQPQQPQQQPLPLSATEVRLMRAEAQIAKVTALVDAVLSGQPVQAAAPEKPPMPELQELSLQFEQFKQTKEAEEKALKAEIKKLQAEAEAHSASVKMYAEVHTRTFNEDRALRERNRWLETQLEDVRASAFQTDFLTPVKVSLLPVGHMSSFAGGSTRNSSGDKPLRQLRKTREQERSAFVPATLGAFPFEELVPSKAAVESAAAVLEATTEAAVSVAAEEVAPATVTDPATSEEALPEVAAALAGVEVAMEEPEAVPAGAEGGAPVTATAAAVPAVKEAEVPVVPPVVATEAPAPIAAPPSAAAPPRGGKGRPAERVPGEGGTPDAKEPKSEDGEGASATGLAPMRLNSNFSAAAGQPEMSDQNRC